MRKTGKAALDLSLNVKNFKSTVRFFGDRVLAGPITFGVGVHAESKRVRLLVNKSLIPKRLYISCSNQLRLNNLKQKKANLLCNLHLLRDAPPPLYPKSAPPNTLIRELSSRSR